MLAITLKIDGSVKIGDDIIVHNNSGSKIKLAIDAPRDVPIIRDDAKKVH